MERSDERNDQTWWESFTKDLPADVLPKPTSAVDWAAWRALENYVEHPKRAGGLPRFVREECVLRTLDERTMMAVERRTMRALLALMGRL